MGEKGGSGMRGRGKEIKRDVRKGGRGMIGKKEEGKETEEKGKGKENNTRRGMKRLERREGGGE